MSSTPTSRAILLSTDDGGASDLPVVLVHSMGGDRSHWRHLLPVLRQAWRAVAVELRGHGQSPAPAGSSFRVEELAADLVHTLDALGLTRAVLIGHSLGGAVCNCVAGAYPARVAGLLLLDPAGDGRLVPEAQYAPMMQALRSEAAWGALTSYWETLMTQAAPEVRAHILGVLRATPLEVLTGVFEGLLHFDPVTPLLAYPGPKRSIVSSFVDAPGLLHTLVPALPYEVIEGAGHWLQLEQPERVNARVLHFLDTLAEEGRSSYAPHGSRGDLLP